MHQQSSPLLLILLPILLFLLVLPCSTLAAQNAITLYTQPISGAYVKPSPSLYITYDTKRLKAEVKSYTAPTGTGLLRFGLVSAPQPGLMASTAIDVSAASFAKGQRKKITLHLNKAGDVESASLRVEPDKALARAAAKSAKQKKNLDNGPAPNDGIEEVMVKVIWGDVEPKKYWWVTAFGLPLTPLLVMAIGRRWRKISKSLQSLSQTLLSSAMSQKSAVDDSKQE